MYICIYIYIYIYTYTHIAALPAGLLFAPGAHAPSGHAS